VPDKLHDGHGQELSDSPLGAGDGRAPRPAGSPRWADVPQTVIELPPPAELQGALCGPYLAHIDRRGGPGWAHRGGPGRRLSEARPGQPLSESLP
jgi:hypothetical protein